MKVGDVSVQLDELSRRCKLLATLQALIAVF